jgi:zinc protease
MSWTTDVVREVLPNGLTVIVQPDRSAPVVAVVSHVRAGYFDEPDEWVGISHVLEHMYFKGTARRGPGELARETQALGGYCNAGTIYDKTVYYSVLPAAGGGLARAVDLQADALMHAALDPDELAREIEVIIQEAKRKQDTPEAVTMESLFAVLFRTHRMRRWRIGTEEGLRRLTAADLGEYYRTRYAPGRVIVGIVGDLDPEAAFAHAQEAFGAWDRPTGPIEGSPPELDPPPAGIDARHGDVERPMAALGWRTVDALHEDAARLDVAAALLGTGRSARLYRGLREPGVVNTIGASHYTPTELGVFMLTLETSAERLDRALEASLGHVAALGTSGPTDAEVARVGRQLRTRWARHFEGMDGRATALCEAEALGGVDLLDRQYEAMLAVTPADVRRVVSEYLAPDAVAGSLYLPEGATAPDDGAWPPAAAVVDVEAVDAQPPEAVAGPGGGGGDHEHAGGIHRRTLANADVLCRQRPGTGLVHVGFHVAGVPALETADTAGLTRLVSRAVLRGAGGRRAADLAELAERLGGSIAGQVGRDTVGWSMTVPTEALEDALRLLELVAAAPDFRDDAVGIERDLQAGDARRARDDMFQYPLQRVLGCAFPGHAYGLPSLGVPERVAAFDASAVRDWHARVLAQRAAVVVVGDVEAADALDCVERVVRWEGRNESAASSLTMPTWSAASDVEHRDKQQSALAMAFPAGTAAEADRERLAVLCSMLSGLAGRLFDELRERRSLAYTVAAMRWQARQAGALLTYVATSPEREDEAREAMIAELRRVVTSPPDEPELDRARTYAAGLLAIARQHASSLAGELVEAWALDALDQPGKRAERLRAVTVDDVVALVERVTAEEPADFVVRGGSSG